MFALVPVGDSPPAHTAHKGMPPGVPNRSVVTVTWMRLTAVGDVQFGVQPFEVIVRSLAPGPLVTLTVKPPILLTEMYCELLYGAGTGFGSGSASAPDVPGLVSPIVSAQIARSIPDSASALACALATWLFAICGSVDASEMNATIN